MDRDQRTPAHLVAAMMLFALFVYESCTPAAPRVEPAPTPPIAAPAQPVAAPAVLPAEDVTPPPPLAPDEAFRAWVDQRIGASPHPGLARWSGHLPVAQGGTVAFEALVCTGASSGGTHEAVWLVEAADGRRWSIPGATDAQCLPANERLPFAIGPASDRVTLTRGNRVSSGGYYDTFSWTFDDAGPYVYASSQHHPGLARTVDAAGCVETIERRMNGEVVADLAGRPAGCGGFGEIPIVEVHARKPTPSLESRLLRGTTDATFEVHAELDAHGFIVLVATIPPVDSPAPKGASIDRLRVSDHFEVWFDEYHSPFAVAVDEQGAAAFAPLEPEDLAGSVVVTSSSGVVRIATGRARYPTWDDPLPATVIFVDGDGQRELGAVSSGPMLSAGPSPFNRVASPSWRYRRDVDNRREVDELPYAEAPADRYTPAP